MAKVTEAIALGIGPQLVDRNTPNPNVVGATQLVDKDGASLLAGEAIGILLRSPEDYNQSFTRNESDGGFVPGSFTRLSGSLQRIEPTVSFTIDVQGGGTAITASPGAGDFNFTNAMESVLRGAGLFRGTPTTSNTPYQINGPGPEWQTLKIWRGINADNADSSWVLVGCGFNFTYNYTPGEKSTLDVDVFATDIIYSDSDTFPDSPIPDYGNQVKPAPILKGANAQISTLERGFLTGSITYANTFEEFPDSNAPQGVVQEITGRSIDWSGDWYGVEPSQDSDYLNLEINDPDSINIDFDLGEPAVAGDDALSVQFSIPHARFEENTKVDAAGKVVRTLNAYASTPVSAPTANLEFELRGI